MLAHAPSVVTNGLVFYYDMFNTQKSWKGKPTTNFFNTVTPNFTNWNGQDIVATDMGNGIQRLQSTSRVQFSAIRSVSYGASANTNAKISYSIDVRGVGQAALQVHQASSTPAGGHGAITTSNLTLTTSWQRMSLTNFYHASDVTAQNFLVIGTAGANNYVEVRNAQVEFSDYVNPYVFGTRSNTQSILDLVGGNTITAANLSYESDGKFKFNGTSSILTVPFNASTFTFDREQTIIIWMTNNASSAARRNPYNQAYGGGGTITHEPGYNFNYYWGQAGTNNTPYTSATSNFTVGVGETAMIAVVRNATDVRWYKNGEFGNTTANPYGATVVTGTAALNIGFGYAGAFEGSIHAVSVYNRALTALEIKQSFSALRMRHGL